MAQQSFRIFQIQFSQRLDFIQVIAYLYHIPTFKHTIAIAESYK